MVDGAKEARERRRRGWIFVVASLAAHVLIAGLIGHVPATIDSADVSTTVPLSFFSPGSGPAPAAAQSGETGAAADSRSSASSGGPQGSAASAAPPRRGPARARPTDPGPGPSIPVTDPNGVEDSPSGTGDDVSSEAFLDALMASSGPQRPQPGACPDPIIGTWRAQRYDSAQEKQAVFMLRIQAHDAGQVRGRITLRAWAGRSQRPPRCAPGVFFHTVRMPARGTFENGELSFRATSFSRTAHCADPGFEYNLDHFTGQANGDDLRAVNNDGGHEVNTAYRFERIACH